MFRNAVEKLSESKGTALGSWILGRFGDISFINIFMMANILIDKVTIED